MVLIKHEDKGITILGIMIFAIATTSYAINGIVDTIMVITFGCFLGCAILMLLILTGLMEV